MKKLALITTIVLGSIAWAQAETVSPYDNVRIQEQGTITRQVTTQTGDAPAQVTTTTQDVQRNVGIDPAPNFTIGGQPAYEIKEEITTSVPEVTTEIIE